VADDQPDMVGSNGHGGTPGLIRRPRRPDDTERNELRLNRPDPDDNGDEGPTLLDAASVESVLTTFPRESRAPAAEVPTPRRSSEDWAKLYRFAVLGLDFLAAVIAGIAAVYLRFYVFDRDVSELPTISGFTYWQFAAIFPLAWVFSMATARAYESRYLGLGADEFKRVFHGAVGLTAISCFVFFTAQLNASRGVIGMALPGATLLALIFRYAARKALHAARRAGKFCHRVLVVGHLNDVIELITAVRREPYAGFIPVGVCLTRRSGRIDLPGPAIPVVGGLSDVLSAVDTLEADMVAVCGQRGVSAEGLRRLAWELEGTGVGLVVAPALTNVAGPRVHVRPVAGLPLLHVDEPVFEGFNHVVKTVVDRLAAVLGMLLLSPALLVIATLVKFTSPGPVLFKQERVGRNGEIFKMWKFRSMYADAEQRRAELLEQNDLDGVLFKMKEDPRITRVGRFLRRWSLDELPNLVNVLVGNMSLVGPRPPLPAEVEEYEQDVKRRLLVRPGITGLWQISGRSNLPWEDAVRLDLYYVDNWSLTYDFMILWKTVFAVIRRHGAY
jgi:exopolysaccharide biosynthesis polyprenyl glycosylphosphotransferase